MNVQNISWFLMNTCPSKMIKVIIPVNTKKHENRMLLAFGFSFLNSSLK